MKKMRKVLIITMIFIVMLSGLTVVNAASKGNVTISDPTINGNKVTFEVTFTDGAVLMGDVNLDGYVDQKDADMLGNIIVVGNYDTLNDIQKSAADLYQRGDGIGVTDLSDINLYYHLLGFQVIGSLCIDSELEVKAEEISNGMKYLVTITIPEATNGGTIGIKLDSTVFSSNENKIIEKGAVGYADDTFNTKDIIKEIGFGDGVSNISVPTDVEEFEISISEGVKKDNKITFNITLPEGVGLRGDVDENGLIYDIEKYVTQDRDGNTIVGWENADQVSIQRRVAQVLGKDAINNDLADFNLNKQIEIADTIALKQAHYQEKNLLELTGTLAKDSIYELVRDDNGNYSVVVTIPENAKEGTVGVKLSKGIFMNADSEVNKEVTSKEVDLAILNNVFKVVDEQQENTDSGKVKVTVTVNEELDPNKLPEGWTLSEDGKSISKLMEDGQKETLKLVSKYGKEIEYTVTAQLFKVVDKKDEDLGNGKVKVTVTVNKELDPDKLPEGWELSEDGKSISKVMDKGAKEELVLVAKDGSTIKYTVIAGDTLKADDTTAKEDIPQTGASNVILVVVAGIAIVGTVLFIRSRKMLK